uniref:Cell division protein FtsZ n=2 Tax=Rhizochromulina marina TaxID=1034831 RepID=A0A7S2WVV6_9STRA
MAEKCSISVVGVGGGGGNAINRMVGVNAASTNLVKFWSLNTDQQVLRSSSCNNILALGERITRGLGCGGDPDVGQQAAQESIPEIRNAIRGSDLVFVTAGMGGGTGSGAAPVVAQQAKKMGALTIGVVTKPFAFEGRKRMKQANEAIARLAEEVDTLVVISNDRLLQIVPDKTPIADAFLVADDILRQGVVGISEIIVKPGLINVNFNALSSVMKEGGTAHMGIGTGRGPNRATDAALAAISSPLLDYPIDQARGIVFNVVGGMDLTLKEINDAAEVIHSSCDPDANIIFGALFEPNMGNEVCITVLAASFDNLTLENLDQTAAAPPKFRRTRSRAGDASRDEARGREENVLDATPRQRRRNTIVALRSMAVLGVSAALLSVGRLLFI